METIRSFTGFRTVTRGRDPLGGSKRATVVPASQVDERAGIEQPVPRAPLRRLADAILLPLLLANITIGANNWELVGFNLGQALFWVIIGLASYIVWESPYRLPGLAALGAGITLRGLESAAGSPVIASLRIVSFAGLFMIVGAITYGRNPRLLHRQLIVFLALCVPVMVLQMSGAHPFFMMWDVDYAHDVSILAADEIGKFKEIPLFPTLFVSVDDLYYQIGQGRPSGLSYANNVLAVFLSITAGVSVAIAKSSRLRLADLVVSCALVLTMSLTSYGSVLLLYLGVLALGESWRKWLVFKIVAIIAALELLYFLVFPGLFAANFSDAKLWISIYTRGLELFDFIGVSWFRQMYDWDATYHSNTISTHETYSGIAIMLKSQIGVVLIMALPFLGGWYWRRLRRLKRTMNAPWLAYVLTALACLFSQFGVPYFQAPAFQFIWGFAMFPLFPRLWPRTEGALAGIPPRGLTARFGSVPSLDRRAWSTERRT